MYPIAIACGNTFVLKPSERDPSAAIFCAQLFADAGLPPGVFNVVHGDKVAVDRLLEHPKVAAISFVGSTPIAQYIYETGTKHGKRVQALGGAKNHMIVLPDADMELAADAAVSAGYGSAGERCMAISVVVAVGNAADKLVPLMQGAHRQAQGRRRPRAGLGDGPARSTRRTATRSPATSTRASREGATLVSDGRALTVAGRDERLLPRPVPVRQREARACRSTRTRSSARCSASTRVATYDDAIKLVNANPYANGVAIFTNDGGAARKFQHEVEVGMVGINVPIPVPMAYYSFGGWKASLFGDHHIYGRDGVHFYTRTKAVTSRWPDPRHRGVDLGFPQNR